MRVQYCIYVCMYVSITYVYYVSSDEHVRSFYYYILACAIIFAQICCLAYLSDGACMARNSMYVC